MPDEDELRERLARLRPRVDEAAGLDNVVREASRRGRRDRVLAGAAVVVVLVLVAGAAFGLGRDGSGRDTEVAAVGTGSTQTGSTATTARGSAVGTPAPGTAAPGTTAVSPDTTDTTSTSLPAPSGPTTTSYPVPTTVPPPPTVVRAPEVLVTLRPASTTVRLGDRLIVDVTVTNRGTAPAHYEGNFCAGGPAAVVVADRPHPPMPIDYTGNIWDGDVHNYERMVAGNSYDDLGFMVRSDLVDQAPSPTCATYSKPSTLAPGESVSGTLAWDVHLAPRDLATPGALWVSGSFDFGVTSGSARDQRAEASTQIELVDDPRRTTTGAMAFTAAASDPAVRAMVEQAQPVGTLAHLWFGRDEWVFVVTGAPMAQVLDRLVVVRVDPDTGTVRSARVLPATELPRI